LLLGTLTAAIAVDESWRLLVPDLDPTTAVWIQRFAAIGIVLTAAVGPTVLVTMLALAMAVTLCFQALASPNGAPATIWSSRMAAIVYAALPIALLVLMRGWSGPNLRLVVGSLAPLEVPRGVGWVGLTVATTWVVDSAAFLIGRAIGRHAFSPRISPKKTWEGTLGGVFLGAAFVVACSQLFRWAWLLGIAFGVLIGWAAILGDLGESWLKRQAGVKDSGSFLPGHGGLLDRIDSLAFSTIVVFLVGTIDASTHLLTLGST
jgi:phosphatidate cytidylyltransferase